LKLIVLVVTRAVSVLGLSWREAWWKEAEILMLRHQLAVALRERPRVHSRLTWPDRAWLALLAGTLPAGRLAELRLIVTPATILRWHRDIVRRWARLSRRGRSGTIGRHILDNLLPARRPRISPRAVKRPLSCYAYKSLRADRRTYQATISIDILTIPLSP
jgi:hypothetical protein